MKATKLILVDGVPGSGKSTTAQFLALQLERQQIPVRWFYELEHNHPIHAFHVWSREGPEHFIDITLRNWEAFVARQIHSSQVSILESSLFQSTVRLLLQSDLSRQRIRHYALRVADIIQDLQPVLIYFSHTDIAAALGKICRTRKTVWEQYLIQVIDGSAYGKHRNLKGFDGTVTFFHEYQELTTAICQQLSIPKLICEDVTQQWPAYRQHICQFLDIRYIPEPVLPERILARFIGCYRDLQSRLELRICFEHDQIAVCGLLWPRSRLIPHGHLRFVVEACTIELCFHEDAHGAVQSMTIEGSSGWKFHGKTLMRVKREHEMDTTSTPGQIECEDVEPIKHQ